MRKQRAIWKLDDVVYDSESELVMATHLKELGLHFEHNWRFYNQREWEADFYLYWANNPMWGCAVLIEVEGGSGYFKNPKGQVIRGGRHTRQKGYEEDCLKYSTASALGFKVFRFTTQQVSDGRAKEFIKEWLVRS